MKIDLTPLEVQILSAEMRHALISINELIKTGNSMFIGDDEKYLKIIEKLEGAYNEQQTANKSNN